MDDWHAHSLSCWIWQNGSFPRLMKCSDAEVFYSEEAWPLAVTVGGPTNSTFPLSNVPSSTKNFFGFLHFKLWPAWTHIGYNWFKEWQVLQRVKKSLHIPPAALSIFLSLLNCLSCFTVTTVTVQLGPQTTTQSRFHFNCLKSKDMQVIPRTHGLYVFRNLKSRTSEHQHRLCQTHFIQSVQCYSDTQAAFI